MRKWYCRMQDPKTHKLGAKQTSSQPTLITETRRKKNKARKQARRSTPIHQNAARGPPPLRNFPGWGIQMHINAYKGITAVKYGTRNLIKNPLRLVLMLRHSCLRRHAVLGAPLWLLDVTWVPHWIHANIGWHGIAGHGWLWWHSRPCSWLWHMWRRSFLGWVCLVVVYAIFGRDRNFRCIQTSLVDKEKCSAMLTGVLGIIY